MSAAVICPDRQPVAGTVVWQPFANLGDSAIERTMTIPVTLYIPHKLGKAEARRRIEEGFSSIQSSMSGGLIGTLSMQKHWENDRLHFNWEALGQKMSGSLDVAENSVQIQIYLPDLLASITDRMKGTLQKQTQRLLENK